MEIDVSNDAVVSANTECAAIARCEAGLKSMYEVACIGPDGETKWAETVTNLVVNTGLDDALDKYFKGSAYTASHFVGLTDGAPTIAAGDTMATHAGWVEVTAYTEGTRQALTLGTVSAQSVDNSASKASFSIGTDNTTVGGAFIATDNTKGGATGTLYGAAAFSAGNKLADNGDTINVTVTLSFSAV